MAWIESHMDLENHPKLFDLMTHMGWNIDVAIGKLHRFWWWCTKFAEDGDLRRHNDDRLARAVGLNSGQEAKKFVEAMVRSCWIDRDPHFRIHDWWEYFGKFLQIKYKHKPDLLKSIRDCYLNGSCNHIPNLTKPNQTIPDQTENTPPAPLTGEDGTSSDEEKRPTPEMLMQLWNDEAPPLLPRVEIMSPGRKTHATSRLKKHPEADFWLKVMRKLNSSRLLRGECKHGDSYWRPTFDFILSENNLAKILDGNYDDKR